MEFKWENRLDYAKNMATEVLAKIAECETVEQKHAEITLAFREAIVEVAISEREKAERK